MLRCPVLFEEDGSDKGQGGCWLGVSESRDTRVG